MERTGEAKKQPTRPLSKSPSHGGALQDELGGFGTLGTLTATAVTLLPLLNTDSDSLASRPLMYSKPSSVPGGISARPCRQHETTKRKNSQPMSGELEARYPDLRRVGSWGCGAEREGQGNPTGAGHQGSHSKAASWGGKWNPTLTLLHHQPQTRDKM